MNSAAVLPPLGSCFERVEMYRGKIAARRIYRLIRSKVPSDPDMNSEHTLVCVFDYKAGGNPDGIVGQVMTVEGAWFTERHDFKRTAL